MIQLTPQMRILVAVEPTDFRRGIDGLARICRDVLGHAPFSGGVFVFRNRPATAVKILVYDGQGFWLCHKRLSRGKFGWWPTGSLSTKTLAAHQLHVLLSAGNPEATQAAPAWRPVGRASCGGHLADRFGITCVLPVLDGLAAKARPTCHALGATAIAFPHLRGRPPWDSSPTGAKVRTVRRRTAIA
jgi:transposase